MAPSGLEHFIFNLPERFKNAILNSCGDLIDESRQIEMEKCISDYNAGYDDAKCNHINDADNYANEIRYNVN